MPYNYFRPPTPMTSVVITNPFCWWYDNNLVSAGGQKNIVSFDLFSYGPDRKTYVNGMGWQTPTAHEDDITNYK